MTDNPFKRELIFEAHVNEPLIDDIPPPANCPCFGANGPLFYCWVGAPNCPHRLPQFDAQQARKAQERSW